MPKIYSDYLHIVITQYNVGLYGARRAHIDSEKWMAHRLPLFTNYCLPSILNQTCPHFFWIVVFDRRTPYRWLNHITSLLSESNMVPILVGPKGNRRQIEMAIRKFAPQTVRFLATSNLDNDDFWAVDFVQRVHEAMQEDRDVPYILDPEFIYAVKEQRVKLQILNPSAHKSKEATPFYTAIEDRQLALTCLYAGHGRIHQFISRHVTMCGCCTGRVIHDWNLAPKNRKNGTPITKDIITNLVDKFGINPTRITKLWRSSQL